MLSPTDDFPIHQTCESIRHPVTSDCNYYDRSWGVRPIGAGPPPSLPEVCWIWSPLHFDDCCVHFGAFEDRHGDCWYTNAAIVPAYATGSEFPLLEEPRGLHVQQLCRTRMGTAVGVGLCEQVVFGPHAPSGFVEFLDSTR